jgi:hypothetical protein
VPLHALKSFFKLRDQWSFAGLETIATHDAPKKIATCPLVRIVYSQHIFGRPARDKDDDVGFGRPVHESQFAPIMNGLLYGTDRVPIFGKQARNELISIIGSNVDITCICQNAPETLVRSR